MDFTQQQPVAGFSQRCSLGPNVLPDPSSCLCPHTHDNSGEHTYSSHTQQQQEVGSVARAWACSTLEPMLPVASLAYGLAHRTLIT